MNKKKRVQPKFYTLSSYIIGYKAIYDESLSALKVYFNNHTVEQYCDINNIENARIFFKGYMAALDDIERDKAKNSALIYNHT